LKDISIDNPVFHELLNLRLINENDIEIINKKTRDHRNLFVYQDKVSKIIFLQKYLKKENFYKKKILNRKLINNRSFSLFDKKKTKTLNLDDQKRRAQMFGKKLLNKKVLDYGCGNGNFLKQITKFTKKIYGLEINNSHLVKLKNKFKIFEKLEDIAEQFDYITLFHVLEHLPNQIKVLKKIKNKLKPNGKLIIEIPQANDFLLKLKLEEFKNFTFWSEHLILHTEDSIKKFLKNSGFKKIQVSFYQRYNLSNHAGWFLDRKPGGHLRHKELFTENEKKLYNIFLIQTKMTDTMIVEASIK